MGRSRVRPKMLTGSSPMTRRTTLSILMLAALGALLGANPAARAQDSDTSLSGWGIVLLHGLQGSPANFNNLAGPLKAHGATVVIPLMAWSRSRMYDATLAHEEAAIDAIIDDLRARGFTKVALGGHSHGGGTALTYAADHRRRLDALIIMAPVAHQGEKTVAEAERAKRLIAEGQGDVPTVFLDGNADRGTETTLYYVTSTPKFYVDWHSAVVNATAAKAALVPPSVPVLWLNGSLDYRLPYQRPAAAALPNNPRSRYVELDTYHLDVPTEGVSTVLDWFASLNR